MLRELWEMYERAVQAKPVTVWDKELKEYVETGEYQFDDKIAMKCLEFIAKLGGMLSEKEAEKSLFFKKYRIKSTHPSQSVPKFDCLMKNKRKMFFIKPEFLSCRKFSSVLLLKPP